MTFDVFLSHFTVKNKNRDKAQCICPAHDDKEASLTISRGKNGILVHCHAGCETADVLGAVGLSMKDLFDDDPVRNTGERWRAYIEGREKRQIEDVYNYVDLNGNYAFTRIRLSGKKFIYGIMDGDRFNYGLNGKSRKSIPAVFCDSLRGLQKTIENGGRVFYCEGEKDVKTVNSHGLTGVTCGASGDWVEDCAVLFDGADVVILQDNDKPGEKSAKTIEKDIRKVAKSVRIVITTPELEHGDVSDYFEDHTVEDFEKFLKEEPKEFEIKLVSGRELQKKDVPPIIYPVENIIPQGYTVASAPFKFGKSWLALEMCLAVAEGADFLGQHTTKGSAVYFALEDCDQFAKERLNMVLDGREAPEGFYYIYDDVPTLDDGLIGYLNQLYKTVPNLKMVVIDVLAKVEFQPMRGESAYRTDYRTGGALKKWADEHLVALISITHTTKMVHPNDVFMNTIGSSAVSGSADALITIAKEKRTSKDATLAVTGRRVREKYFKVHLRDGYIWETDGEVDPEMMEINQAKREQEERLAEYMKSPIREALIQIACAGIEKDLSSREIIEMARDKEIYLHETVAEIGLFIHKFQNYLFTEDRVKTYIRKRGTGSNLYRLAIWEPADEKMDETFIE